MIGQRATDDLSRARPSTDISGIMKQRVTYVVEKPDKFSPEQLSVQNAGQAGPRFALQGVHAAKEHRSTLALSELPEEVQYPSSPPAEGSDELTLASSVLSSNNGTSCTSAGHRQRASQQYRPLHHVCHPVYMSSLRLWTQPLKMRYASSCTRSSVST